MTTTNKLKRVTEKELAHILFNMGTTKGMPLFASVLQITEPKCLVKSRKDKEIKNTYGTIKKMSKVGIILNTDYEKAVTNQLAREDKEASEYQKGANTMPLTFGEFNQFIGLYEKTGELVLQYRPNDNVNPRTKYLSNGKLIDKAKIVDFLPLESHATNQGTDREIMWRKLYLKNVVKIAINKQVYKIVR